MHWSGKYAAIERCIINVLRESPEPLKQGEILENVHRNITSGILSPDSVTEHHRNNWNKYEWQHEVERGLYYLKRREEHGIIFDAGQIVYDPKTKTYELINKPSLKADKLVDCKTEKEMYEVAGKLSVKELNDLIERFQKKQSSPDRISSNVQRFKRNQALSMLVKIKYSFRCQFCGFTFQKKDGTNYAEVAHISALKKGGQDAFVNMLVLCPNHHKMLDEADSKIVSRSPTMIRFLINGQTFEAEL